MALTFHSHISALFLCLLLYASVALICLDSCFYSRPRMIIWRLQLFAVVGTIILLPFHFNIFLFFCQTDSHVFFALFLRTFTSFTYPPTPCLTASPTCFAHHPLLPRHAAEPVYFVAYFGHHPLLFYLSLLQWRTLTYVSVSVLETTATVDSTTRDISYALAGLAFMFFLWKARDHRLLPQQAKDTRRAKLRRRLIALTR